MTSFVRQGLGPGFVDAIRGCFASGPQRVLIVSSENGQRRRSFQFARSLLQAHNVQVFDYALPPSVANGAEPRVLSVMSGIELARRTGCGTVLGIGGGSVMDVSKCIGAFTREPVATAADVDKYFNKVVFDTVEPPKVEFLEEPLPVVTFPTVSLVGGSESSRIVSLKNFDTDCRMTLEHERFSPALSFQDPKLVLGEEKYEQKPDWSKFSLEYFNALAESSDQNCGEWYDETLSQLKKGRDAKEAVQACEAALTASFEFGLRLRNVDIIPKTKLGLLASNICSVHPARYSRIVTLFSILLSSDSDWDNITDQDVIENAARYVDLCTSIVESEHLSLELLTSTIDTISAQSDGAFPKDRVAIILTLCWSALQDAFKQDCANRGKNIPLEHPLKKL
mmetsp:Transcript_20130/g.33245  ORF Transcript_20130/g.33245 Transcript_20130/m.33245 type:complete len:395 (-) Transcript_20130:31-1215(-)|eukprot:CAMPEP_0203775852 /NCGR_PEP_ID=MMETSP0099_2-20121227/6376_1 /ASSEMBLY_ACC=CAM_ASM_000209 /TAXON_ID=96639 /ORGANISM=" , Strain NY0313808BC1" /LENGTH=394 /DNA_ID=CAMNT_0050674705 /DNA_START=315 /DNA_END=1499 /DNA_ORIENTATION=-